MKRFFISLFILSAIPVGAKAAEPGLHLRLDAGEKTDHRVSRLAAIRVPGDEPVSARLDAGRFSAVWSGFLNLEQRSRVYFSLEGTGEATLFINEEQVVEGFGPESSRLRLNPGAHPIRLEYTSPEAGPAAVRLFWRGRDFLKEPVPPNRFTHESDEGLAASLEWRRGRLLFAQHHCAKCHGAGPDWTMNELQADAPSLEGIGDRVKADWMAAWIQHPHRLRPQARMPGMQVDRQTAVDIVAFLSAKTSGADAFTPEPEHVTKGGHLFHDLGCIGCHTRPDEVKEDPDRIGLDQVAWKFKPDGLKAFLQKPNRHYKWVRMPDFLLNDAKAEALTAFLVSASSRHARSS
ncbi:MAG: c-type cytochrome, partial [Verrucomicrobiota bacterium]